MTMTNSAEKSLTSVLRYTRLRELPQEDNGKNVWIMAIVLVRKSDGSTNYAVADKDADGKMRIMKDFGSVCSIFSIDDIYPFAYLGVEYMPVFKTQKKEERIEWLNKNASQRDYTGFTLKELDKMILNNQVLLAIKNFKNNMDYGK